MQKLLPKSPPLPSLLLKLAQRQKQTEQAAIARAEKAEQATAERPPVPKLLDFLKSAWTEVLHPAEELSLPWCVELIAEHLTAISIAGLVQIAVSAIARQSALSSLAHSGDMPRAEAEAAIKLLSQRAQQAMQQAEALAAPYHLTAIEAQQRSNKKLLVNLPPRFTKSTLITVVWPCWEWLSMPWIPWMCLSYDSGLANDHNDDRRKIVASEWYQEMAGGMALSRSKNRLSEFENSDRGIMLSRGLNAGVTGHGSIRQIYDDPNDPQNVETASVRATALKRFKDYSLTRRNNPAMSATVIVQQRTHFSDVSGYIVENMPDYFHICFPMEAERDELMLYPLSGQIVERKFGDILDPTRFPPAVIQELKADSYLWAGRYQQRPAPLEGGMIKQEWIKRYTTLPANPEKIVISLDTAAKAKEINDPWCWQVWYVKEGLYYLAHVLTKRCEYPEGKRLTKNLMAQWRPTHTLIEDKSTGQSLIPELRNDPDYREFNVIAIEPCGDKITRMSVETGAMEAGRVFFPELALWLADYETVLFSFPNSAIDDPVDATSQFLGWVKQARTVMLQPAQMRSHSSAPKVF
jgi:predicted phage terminase large subunit-like protein